MKDKEQTSCGKSRVRVIKEKTKKMKEELLIWLALSSSLPLPSYPVLGAVMMSAPATPPVPLPSHVVVVAVVGCWKCQRYKVEEIQVLARHGWL